MLLLTKLVRGLVALASLAGVALGAYPAPGACSGDCWTHDPAVVKRADGTYFRFSTGGGIGVYKASALTGSWTYQGVALASGSSISVTGNAGTDLWVCGLALSLSLSLFIIWYPVCRGGRMFWCIRWYMVERGLTSLDFARRLWSSLWDLRTTCTML